MKIRSINFAFSILLIPCLSLLGCSTKSDNSETMNDKLVVTDYAAQGILAKSLPEIATAIKQQEITSEALVNLYLARIAAVDKNGPTLQAILTLNPDALQQAKALDELLASGNIKGPLHGVPILLKDNIESKDNMATTAGALALQNNITGRDSPLVAGLRNQGAIILGKTNLSQWANFRSESSMSGWSALGGQVRNPHMLDRNPCGSSSGSGAAIAASLAAGTVGTETNGSVICPSNANGVVGFKPTVGVIPQQYIIPISASQDTAGPMTKTVRGAAMMMNAMATQTPNIDYTAKLNKHALQGIRVGVLNFAKGGNAAILMQFNSALESLVAAGAILVNIDERPESPESFNKSSYDLLKYEFKDGLNHYLASTSPEQVNTRTLSELIDFNIENSEVELALFDQSILLAANKLESLESKEYLEVVQLVQKSTRKNGIDKLLKKHNVAVLIAPSGPIVPLIDAINGDVWPNDWPGFGSQAAIAGYPHVTVPMGGVKFIPIGLSFIGGKNTDADILAYSYAFEQHSKRRLEPKYFKSAEQVPVLNKAMKPLRK